MKLFDATFASPAENLACDEALLDWSEDGGGEEILRFWEPSDYFVVVGYANKVAAEVNVAACAENRIPVLRRCSGGGTVLQGPGCLNYSLVLNISKHAPLEGISSANRFIMERNRAAVQKTVAENGTRNTDISVAGHTDLILATHRASPGTAKKFSGNAQRRKRNCLLFHGTFLLHFDLALVEKFLKMPSLQPDYRQDRPHQDFLANLNLATNQVKHALCDAWGALEHLEFDLNEEAGSRLRDKYATNEWNYKF